MNDQPAVSPALSPEPSLPPGADEPRRGPVARARDSLRALEALDRISGQGAGPPSEADLAALREWGGWGPMAPAFAPGRRGGWREIGERLEWLLPPSQLREAEQATPNAFYTPPPIAASCWQILTGLGFTGGRVLEPGCGAGAFLASVPAGLRVSWTGVERDPVTARIAQLLHPAALILAQPLQQAALPAHSADAVIGNVPFSDTGVYDPAAPQAVTRSLHNYCVWRSVRTLRPGGLAVLITSRYTLDSRDDGARQAIADDADLVGAIRLPGAALAGGGTEVVADIVVLRRRDGDRPDGNLGWLRALRLAEVFPGQEWGFRDHVNEWLAARPRMVLGEMLPDQGARYGRTLRVTRPGAPAGLAEDLAGAGSAIAAEAARRRLTWQAASGPAGCVSDLGLARRADGRKERSFHLIDGAVCQVVSGELVPPGRAAGRRASWRRWSGSAMRPSCCWTPRPTTTGAMTRSPRRARRSARPTTGTSRPTGR
jgi:SAM-dependent methyltransferase